MIFTLEQYLWSEKIDIVHKEKQGDFPAFLLPENECVTQTILEHDI